MRSILFLFICFPAYLYASNECDNIQVSDQVYLCSRQAFEVSDAELNQVYKRLLQSVNKNYQTHIEERNEYIKKIKFSQRAWIDFRDKNCEARSYQIEVGTQAYESSLYACKDKMTQERIKELNFMINE